MSSPVTTSIVINFQQDEEGILTAEIDSRSTSEGGYNGGNTSFSPGDSPVFLLYWSNNVLVTLKTVSDGSLVTLGFPLVTKTEQLQFANKREADLSYPYVSGFTVKRRSPTMTVDPTLNGNKVRFATDQIGIVEVEYQTRAEAIRVQNPSGDLPALVYIEGIAQ